MAQWPDGRLWLHTGVADRSGASVFERTADLVAERFEHSDGLIFIGPSGVMVRALAPLVHSKLTDPPVVVVDTGGRHAISLLSGHEGGANDLALTVANILGAEPVITTTTEADKDLIVGIGCRKGCAAEAIVAAVRWGLAQVDADPGRVRFLASADIKREEAGLIAAARLLAIPLRLIASEDIRACIKGFTPNPVARKNVALPAVAEPAALLAGRRTRLILPKTIHRSVTVAVARENFLSSVSGREA
jgi:cobalt-precorrin 5A hydrolase